MCQLEGGEFAVRRSTVGLFPHERASRRGLLGLRGRSSAQTVAPISQERKVSTFTSLDVLTNTGTPTVTGGTMILPVPPGRVGRLPCV